MNGEDGIRQKPQKDKLRGINLARLSMFLFVQDRLDITDFDCVLTTQGNQKTGDHHKQKRGKRRRQWR